MLPLDRLGFHPFFAAQLELLPDAADLRPARVIADSGGIYELAGCRAPLGELSGRLRHTARPADRPTTGDWVAVDDSADRAVIHHVLDRRTLLRRRAAGSDSLPQLVAANVDVFFIVTSANRDLSPRRIERYLTAVWDSGARPVIVLNKIDLVTDLVDDAAAMRQAIEEVAAGVPVISASAHAGTGLDELRDQLAVGVTIGFIGSSGVGKSSLINRLLGHDAHATNDTRADGKGRHTTTRRELIVLPDGGILIDTPGMRELGLIADDAALEATFSDIARLAEQCRFRDCTHHNEPGCAVQAAAEAGTLAQERVHSHHKLRNELAAAEARRDPVLAANTKRRWKTIHKEIRAFSKSNHKRRE